MKNKFSHKMFERYGTLNLKLVKGISLFLTAIGLFIIGCFLGFEGHDFFYPGMRMSQESESSPSTIPEEKIQVSSRDENIISADTSFIVIEVNLEDQSEQVQEIPVPTYYMGMNREDFEKQIQNFDRSPSLQEMQKGFQGSEIRSFSGGKVELCKFYQEPQEEEEEYYYLAISQNKVVVYKADGRTIYMETDIPAEDLPPDVLLELVQKRVVNTEEDLYDFLESYSS